MPGGAFSCSVATFLGLPPSEPRVDGRPFRLVTPSPSWSDSPMTSARRVAVACLALSLAFIPARADQAPVTTEQDRQRLARFEKQVDEIRTVLEIPGMSAAIVKNQQVIWSKGFGYADVENKVPATPQTLYHVASLTKTFASTLVMQLVEQGKLDLDEPVSRYTTEIQGDSVHVKHLLSHTSEGTPGEHYSYNGNRYALLTPVLEKKTGKS